MSMRGTTRPTLDLMGSSWPRRASSWMPLKVCSSAFLASSWESLASSFASSP